MELWCSGFGNEIAEEHSYALKLFVMCLVLVCWFSDRLKHPNIVQLLETYEDKSKVYLVMEL